MKNVEKTTKIPINSSCELSKEDLENVFKGAQIKLKESLNITENIKESIKQGADDGRSYHTDPGDNSQIENLAPLLSRSGNNNTKMLLLQNVIIVAILYSRHSIDRSINSASKGARSDEKSLSFIQGIQ